ncbi:MAG: peptide chain release factor 1 [Nitrospinota bacterium]|nr:peptide chain release factor 1 [Nitrospinota bacterium]
MFDKLGTTLVHYNELGELLSQKETIANQNEFRRLSKEYSSLTDIVQIYKRYLSLKGEIASNREIIEEKGADKELVAMAEDEVKILTKDLKSVEEEIKVALIPKDPDDEKNIILEIRAGTGGDEASLFAAEIFRMYSKYAEMKGWKIEVMGSTDTGKGGVKEIIGSISGKGVYKFLKYESGTHRVQRVPETEASGRIHTSAITVAILPEAEEVEVNIRPEDIRYDVFRSGGAGGQSVNTTDSGVRLTHMPSGIVISMQDEKSQHKNKDKAMKILRAKLYDKYQREQDDDRAKFRKDQVGSGDRSEKIRTYNFPQGRVTDHRVGLTLYKLEQVMNGDLHELLEKIMLFYQTKLIESADAVAVNSGKK